MAEEEFEYIAADSKIKVFSARAHCLLFLHLLHLKILTSFNVYDSTVAFVHYVKGACHAFSGKLDLI